MPLAGKVLMPRDIAALGKPHWSGVELAKMVATALGESAAYVGAWNDNLDSSGKVLSRDCGLMQINIPAAQIGSSVEETLRTTSTDPHVYEPVLIANVARAYQLYEAPGGNTGHRRWQPWVAYTTGWATFPAWWTWHHDAGGKAVGPWMKTGRYIQRAIPGVANYHLVDAKDMSQGQALVLAQSLAHIFEVDGTLGVSKGIVGWTKVPTKPTSPPPDGDGPRPVANSGA